MAKVYGDRWEIVKDLPEGGQAFTYKVVDRKGEGSSFYVLKRLKNKSRAKRFKREVEAIRNLTHENVLRLIDFDLEAPEPYLVSEYCAGGALSVAEPFWRHWPADALKLFEEIVAGVRHAHNSSVVHRDLKPDNIFLRGDRGPAVVGDFGLCLLNEEDQNAEGQRITATEEAVGARLYMAPELEDGRLEDVRPSADIYALGKVLYWLLTGRTFSREKHRSPEWDLRKHYVDVFSGQGSIFLEHVNDLLDLMIVEDPTRRRPIENIAILVAQTRRLVEREYHPLLDDPLQPCDFCGRGYYRLSVAGRPIDVQNFGFTPVGTAHWRILTCSYCGHVQAFRTDLGDADPSWKSMPSTT